MAKRRISEQEVSDVLRMARQGMHLRCIARFSGVSTTGVTGICDRAGLRLVKAKRGPAKKCEVSR